MNQYDHEKTLPLINVVNRNLEYVGQFLLDTGSEGNLIKISSLPADCEIDINNTVSLKRIRGKVIPTLGSVEFVIFGYTTKFHIVSDKFPILCEGLLGVEYFENSYAVLNFEQTFLKVGEKCYAFKVKKMLYSRNKNEDVNITSTLNEGNISTQEERVKCDQTSESEDDISEVWGFENSLGEQYHLYHTNQTTVEDLDISKDTNLLSEGHFDVFSIFRTGIKQMESETHIKESLTHKIRLDSLKEILDLKHLEQNERDQV